MHFAPSQPYLIPYKDTAGVADPAAPGGDAALGTANRGVYTLASGTNYFVEVPCSDAGLVHVLLQGDAALILTSVTIEETDLDGKDALVITDTTGTWLVTDDTRITAKAEGAGWTIGANDIAAVAGGAAGAASFNISDVGARRMRVKIVVGGTGGEVRVSFWGKE